MPDGYCDPANDPEKNARMRAQKERSLRDNPIGMGGEGKFLDVKLKDYPFVVQICENYCGPAATQGVLAYYGIEASQKDIAKKEKTGVCDIGKGTCLNRIQDVLNSTIEDKTFVQDNIGPADRKSSPTERAAHRMQNATALIQWVILDVTDLNQPVIALINQTPAIPKYHFLGFDGKTRKRDLGYDPTRAHYITLIGYRGSYTGEDGSAIFYFRESTGRNRNREEVDANIVLEDLESNNGYGSCAGDSNILW